MYARRSGRIYPDDSSTASPNSVKPLLNPYSLQQSNTQLQEEGPLVQTRYFNSPMIQQLISATKDEKPVVCKVEPPDLIDSQITYTTASTATSATTKALNKVEGATPSKKIPRKGGGVIIHTTRRNYRMSSAIVYSLVKAKIPMVQKKKIINKRLSKLLTPRSGLSFLNELKPGCVYKIQEQPGCFPPSFFAQVELGNSILGTGQGLSKSQAKNSAAENAIQRIVSTAMSQQNQAANPGAATSEETPESIPWAGLASFALYKMFAEWQNQGTDPVSETIPTSKKKSKNKNANKAPPKKVLPPNATECHPTAVLNFMHPGVTAVELEREDGPRCRVKVGFTVDGQMFTGISGNKKDARREAAKAALLSLYGLTYPS